MYHKVTLSVGPKKRRGCNVENIHESVKVCAHLTTKVREGFKSSIFLSKAPLHFAYLLNGPKTSRIFKY